MIRAVNVITTVGAVVLLMMSLWPGFAGGCFLLVALPIIGLVAVAWLLAVSYQLPRPWGQSKPLTKRQIFLAPLLVCLTFGLLMFYITRRIAFVFVQSQFDRYVPSATTSPSSGGTKLGAKLGIYHVDQYAIDPRGGVYFRTGSANDGFGPDTISYGFVYRPNRQGTPFGATDYFVRRLTGDWYWFQASDD